jgi:para-nitrobenzyl esterase
VGFRSDEGAHVWRGIPFAKPPLGPLRWRAPLPPEPWSGTRQSVEFGNACPQFVGPQGLSDGREPTEVRGSEDCLYANVFAPPFGPDAVPEGQKRLPVMVWIHGGGNSIGDAFVYNGARLAVSQELIIVTVHYRLGVLGWFSHPSLRTKENHADDLSGNYGTLDLVRALEWVRDNIASFGGDPGRVTVFGESAGGTNVYSLLLSPRAHGLFHGAISQSGSTSTSTRTDAENYTDDSISGDAHSSRELVLKLLIGDGRATDRDAAKVIAASMPDAEFAEYLRSKTIDELLAIFEAAGLGGMYSIPELVRDGTVLPDEDPLDSFARSDGYNDVPVMLGTNRDETRLFMLFGSEFVARAFGLPLWMKDASRYQLEAEYQSAMWKASGVDEPAAAMAGVAGANVYGYRFDWDEQPKLLWLDFAELLGACHAMEIPFVFGTLDFGQANRFVFDESRRPAANALSDAMMSYWAEFAYTGDPGQGRESKLPRWNRWAANNGAFMVLDTDSGGGLRMSTETLDKQSLIAKAEADPRLADAAERCAVYRGFVQWSNRMSATEYDQVSSGACQAYPLESVP